MASYTKSGTSKPTKVTAMLNNTVFSALSYSSTCLLGLKNKEPQEDHHRKRIGGRVR